MKSISIGLAATGLLAIVAGATPGCRQASNEDTAAANRPADGAALAARPADGRIIPPFGAQPVATPAAPADTPVPGVPGDSAPPAADPAPAPAAALADAALPLGEYGCIGSGTTQLAGMGSKLLPGGRYTDLDGGSPGTYTIAGDTISFHGGHLDGQTGRDIRNQGYTIGRMVSCQKW